MTKCPFTYNIMEYSTRICAEIRKCVECFENVCYKIKLIFNSLNISNHLDSHNTYIVILKIKYKDRGASPSKTLVY